MFSKARRLSFVPITFGEKDDANGPVEIVDVGGAVVESNRRQSVK